ncbi:MAG: hypothetical protein LC797_04525 [Chloroflexi bacterium]|nr:hypothetical protein [Chloroflexota bacterium]
MSEYQYYEFAAIDRPLTIEQMRRLRALSTRATITPTRFCNSYTWGDFKGDPLALMEEYFDAFVYVTHWGTHELMLRLPRRLLSRAAADTYCMAEKIRAKYQGDHIIITFRSEDEHAADVDEDDGAGWMSSLSPLRAELASGDRRGLYLGWLAGAQALDLDDDALEPPVPSGLGALSTPQQMLASFLRLDPDLVYVASEASRPLEPAASRQSIEAWVRGLTDSDKTKLLVRLLADDDPQHLHAELIQRLAQAIGPAAEQGIGGTGARRTVEQLFGAAARRAEARTRAAVERAEAERQKRARAEAAARGRYLDGLIGRVDELWQHVEALVATKRQTDYDAAVRAIHDLHDLAARRGQLDVFAPRLQQLRARHAKKVSLLDRLDRAPLT